MTVLASGWSNVEVYQHRVMNVRRGRGAHGPLLPPLYDWHDFTVKRVVVWSFTCPVMYCHDRGAEGAKAQRIAH